MIYKKYIYSIYTWEAFGPGGRYWYSPVAPWQTGHVPDGLTPVILKEEVVIGTGVAGAGVEGHRAAIPDGPKASFRWWLKI